MQTINQTSVRWALALAAFFALFAGVVAGAQGATGGASSYNPESAVEGAYTFGAPGAAHEKPPCGTTVKFVYHGGTVVTQVIDRGPYGKGRAWDRTKAASEARGFEGEDQVRYGIAIGDATSARSD